MTRFTLLLLLCVSLIRPAFADEFSHIFNGSVGSWQGQLFYRDYQSGKRFGIPMQAEISLTPDSATQISKLTYTDPGVLVHAVGLVTIDRETGELVETYFREGKGELFRHTLLEIAYVSDTNWHYSYQLEGTDANRPALIKHSVKREDDQLTSNKYVKFVDEPSEFILRNGTELTLQKK